MKLIKSILVLAFAAVAIWLIIASLVILHG